MGSLAVALARVTETLQEAEARQDALARQEAQHRQELVEALDARKALEAQKTVLERRPSAGAPDQGAVAALKRRVVELHKAELALRDRSPAGPRVRQAALESTRQALQEAQLELAMLTRARGVYTVQPGDHLYGIAEFFYHDASRWPEIAAANAPLLARPEHMPPGSVLVIPR